MTSKKNILVTGANGQLGMELRTIAPSYAQYNFLFAGKEELPIDNVDAIKKYFAKQPVDFCINCAGFTAVDKAEAEKEQAFLVNGTSVGDLAAVCRTYSTQLIHISTDYVFDGEACTPYKETDPTNPINCYGESKLKGERLAMQNDPSAIIIRTSWLYSSYGNNFVRAMLRLLNERDSIKVVSDQYGCPTYAADLADTILVIVEKLAIDNRQSVPIAIESNEQLATDKQSTIFHYCNGGKTTWYEFALAIKGLSISACKIDPITTSEYPTAAKRPQYSALDTRKIRQEFNISIPEWKVSLEKCTRKMGSGK